MATRFPHRIDVRLPLSVKKELQAKAKRQKMSVNALIRKWIDTLDDPAVVQALRSKVKGSQNEK